MSSTCGRCRDQRWVLADPESNTAMPCPLCNEEQHQRWREGAWRPETHRQRTHSDGATPEQFYESLEAARRVLDRRQK